MFLQVPPTVCWTTFADPTTLVNIGTDVLALLCQNIVIFHDVNTKVKSYYKADNIDTCGGISLLAGNSRFPLFAIAEQVLRPSIFLLKYPEMEKLAEFSTTTAVSYIDLHLSEYGFLLAITDAPNYTLHMWNFRTGVHVTSINTRKCSTFCMYVTPFSEPSLIQYSLWHREIIGWELCFTAEKYVFQEVLTMKLGDDYDKSNLFHIVFGESFYIVNDYGVVSSLSAGSFALKPEWKTPENFTEPTAFKLFYNKAGLLVLNDTSLYFIKKRQQDFVLDWQIKDMRIQIFKMISDVNGNIYASTDFGNIYYVDYNQEGGSLRELSNTNCKVLDYCLLKGIKEEVVLLLIEGGEVRLVDMIFMNKFSSLNIKDACCISTHNSAPFVAVGTITGKIHFILYEKLRTPVELTPLEVDKVEIMQVLLHDNIALVQDKLNGFHILMCDYKADKFTVAMSLEREGKEATYILKTFMLDAERAVIFITTDKDSVERFAKYLCLLSWRLNDLFVLRRQFKLPYIYQDFTVIQPYTKDKVEFMGIRKDDFIFDMLILEKDKAIVINYSIRTYHFGHINSISGSRNVITSATQGIIYHFQTHKRNKNPYCISRPLLTTYAPRLRKRMDDCFRSRFLLLLYAGGYLLAFRLPSLSDSLRENEYIEGETKKVIKKYTDVQENLRSQTIIVVPEVNEKDLAERKKILDDLNSIRQSMYDLINYDISVTGQSHGIYRKFCINTFWLAKLIEASRILCERERTQLLEAVQDQTRIRNWILDLIKSSKNFFSTKLRSIFTHVCLDNYAMYPSMQELLEKFDYFRFYDLELDENELEDVPDDVQMSDSEEQQETETKKLKHFVLEKERSVFEHVMSKDFEMQDIKIVTFNQMYNEDAKLQVVLIDALKQEFNKEFSLQKAHKQETITEILNFNAALEKIYSNMNCMLCLLNMGTFKPPELSIPQWARDENIERILQVDDSEIKAINRRKKIISRTEIKSGRMLLWPLEYWVRTLIFMMDGVLEKLWEEEIKKNPPEPEFLIKKQVIDYSLEDQKQLKEYEKKLVVLEEDRHKYLRILKENEVKTLNRKKSYILKFNEHIAKMAILKLKYDFAIRHEQLRLLNSKISNFNRIECKKRINNQREHVDRVIEYVSKYTKMVEFWDRTFIETKSKLETQTHRDKQIERQFKGQYLNSIPAHLTYELNKIYKRRPKLPTKASNIANICFELADRIVSKKQYKFPLPPEMQEFLTLLDSLDELQNCPHQLDHKHWENFVKIRRQKLESELRLKAIGHQLVEAQDGINFYSKELSTIKGTRTELMNSLAESVAQYYDITQNRTVELILTIGQVEVNVRNSFLGSSSSFMIINVDDIKEVNEMIRTAGRKKINAMQRVAFFRRQVIYKEWEHKVVKTNIEYLEYVLKLIQNCKISYEFLEILRNWKKLQENKNASSVLGSIELKINERIEGATKNLKNIENKIELIKAEIGNVHLANNAVNKQIADLKTDVTMLNASRDVLSEEKRARERNERFLKMRTHSHLIDTVRRDYVQILELSTILELQRLRTYPTLGPAPQCAFD